MFGRRHVEQHAKPGPCRRNPFKVGSRRHVALECEANGVRRQPADLMPTCTGTRTPAGCSGCRFGLPSARRFCRFETPETRPVATRSP
jgi:hypothetical protein